MPRHPPAPTAGGPLVAVTATVRTDDDTPRVRLTAAYLSILERAGLTPVVLPPGRGTDADATARVERVLDAVSGLVLTGGEDVAPARYGAAPSPHLGRVSLARDATEIAAVLAARERRVPTLAICRGIQVLNVALGGTLVQDIPSERPAALGHDPEEPRRMRTHPITVAAHSRLARALGATTLTVNSVHHQSVDRVAAPLVVTAEAPDGIVEGVETPLQDPWWAVGVQWHPEEFANDSEALDHGLFAAFAAVLEGITAPSA